MFYVLEAILENIKHVEIKNLNKIKISNNDYIYHAGTKFDKMQLISNGGRVLNITSVGRNFATIRKKIISIIKKINFKTGFYRKDIGRRVIK